MSADRNTMSGLRGFEIIQRNLDKWPRGRNSIFGENTPTGSMKRVWTFARGFYEPRVTKLGTFRGLETAFLAFENFVYNFVSSRGA